MYINKKLKGTKAIIIDIFKNHPEWNAAQIHKEYLARVPKKEARTLNAIQKALEKIKPEYAKIQDLDKPWHLGSLEEYNLPSEAIPYVLAVQDFSEKYPDQLFKEPRQPVTIRQAKWIARLYGIVAASGFKFKSNWPFKDNKVKVAAYLYDWSKLYALHEITCKLSNIPFNTTELDLALRNGANPVVVEQQYIIAYDDKTFRVDPVTAKQLNGNNKKDGE